MSRPFRFAVQAMQLDDAEALRSLARRCEKKGYAEGFAPLVERLAGR